MRRALPIRIKPEEWLGDFAGCSLAAQGLYLRLMFVARDGEPYGHLAANGQPIPHDILAHRSGCSLEQFTELLAELEAFGVLDRTPDGGVVYSERLAKEGRRRTSAARRQQIHREKNRRARNTTVTSAVTPPAEPSDHASESGPTNGARTSMPRSILLGRPRRPHVSPLGRPLAEKGNSRPSVAQESTLREFGGANV